MLEKYDFWLGGMQAEAPAAGERTPYAHLHSRQTHGGRRAAALGPELQLARENFRPWLQQPRG
jgi:hypothetical protein